MAEQPDGGGWRREDVLMDASEESAVLTACVSALEPLTGTERLRALRYLLTRLTPDQFVRLDLGGSDDEIAVSDELTDLLTPTGEDQPPLSVRESVACILGWLHERRVHDTLDGLF